MESKISKHQEYQSSRGLSKEGGWGLIERNLTLDWRIIIRYLEFQIEEGEGGGIKEEGTWTKRELTKIWSCRGELYLRIEWAY